MAAPIRKKSRKKAFVTRMPILLIVALIIGAVVGYYFYSPTIKRNEAEPKSALSDLKPDIPAASISKEANIEQPAIAPSPLKERNEYPLPTIIPDSEKNKIDGNGNLPARLAIIIDDMGKNMSEASSLAAIRVPLTFSIIPGLRHGAEVASYAASHNIETMIHVPMQPKGWPSRLLEENGLLVSMSAGEVQKRLDGFVQQFPGAVGVNNHMGSEFTEQEEKMTVLLQTLNKHKLFFVDSVTSPDSVGYNVAQQLGIRSARRDVFLDNEQRRSYILNQLGQAVRLARKNGSAIAICHPYPVTISTLAGALPGLAGQGVRLVPVSKLVK